MVSKEEKLEAIENAQSYFQDILDELEQDFNIDDQIEMDDEEIESHIFELLSYDLAIEALNRWYEEIEQGLVK